jgi:hypothetical protein
MLDLILYSLIFFFIDLSGCVLLTSVFNGTNDFVEYRPGNTNLIISVPHDGSLKPGKQYILK